MTDTRQYSWADVEVVIAGKSIVGNRGVKYKEVQEKEPLHARGNKPIAIQKGNKTYEGEVILLQGEIEALKEATKKASVLDMEFDLTISYVARDGGAMIVDQLKGCQFTEKEKGMEQGAKFMEVTMPIIALDLKENV